jgi:hypothetical protein
MEDFGEVHREQGKIYQRMVVRGDGESLWRSSHEGEIKQWTVRGRAMVQDLSKPGFESSYPVWG